MSREIPFFASTSLFCLFCTIQHYYNTFFLPLLHYFVYSVPFNITTIPFFCLYFTILFILYHSTLLQYLFFASTSLFCLFCAIQHYYNTFCLPLLHYFVYSVPFNITTTPFFLPLLHYFVYTVLFNITTIPLFGLYFTNLFILYHSTLLQYLYLVSTSLICLFCAIQHYYNTLFLPLLHYFVYSVPFNITTIPFFCLYFTILFILCHSTLLQYLFLSLLHYFVYSVPFNITTIPLFGLYFTILFILCHSTLLQYPFFCLYFTILFILCHSTLLQYLFLVSTSLFCLFCTIQHYYNTFFCLYFTILFILCHSTLLQYLFLPLLHYFVYSVPFNITTIPFFGLYFTILFILCHSTLLQHLFLPLLHYFVYSVPFNITTIPFFVSTSLFCLFCAIQHYYNTFFCLYFTILFILYHSTLLQYLYLVSTSLFCLFCTIQHYYNTFFCLYFTILFILYHSTLLQHLSLPLLHYFVYSVPFNITTIPFLATASLFCLFCTIQHYYNTFFGHCFTILFILYHSTLLQYLLMSST